MATKKKTTSTSSTKPTSKAKVAEKPQEDPLAAYLQPVHLGDATGGFWVAELTQGGHTTTLQAKSREEIQERAKAILKARGVEI